MTRPVTTGARILAGHSPDPDTIPDSHLRNPGHPPHCKGATRRPAPSRSTTPSARSWMRSAATATNRRCGSKMSRFTALSDNRSGHRWASGSQPSTIITWLAVHSLITNLSPSHGYPRPTTSPSSRARCERPAAKYRTRCRPAAGQPYAVHLRTSTRGREPGPGMGHVTLWCGACSAGDDSDTRPYGPPHEAGRNRPLSGWAHGRCFSVSGTTAGAAGVRPRDPTGGLWGPAVV